MLYSHVFYFWQIRHIALIKLFAGIAQLVEQRIRNAQVECSSHFTSSKTTPVIIEITGVVCFY